MPDDNKKMVEISEEEKVTLLAAKDKVGQLETQQKESAAALEKLERENKEWGDLFQDEDKLKAVISQKEKKTAPVSEIVKDEEGELDDLTPKQIIKLLRTERQKEIDEVKKDYAGRISALDRKAGIGFARADLRITSGQNKDFWDYEKRIFEISKESPEWTSEQCYKKAKGEKEESLRVKATEEKEQKEKEKKAFSEKGELPESVLANKDLSDQEAAEKAYEMTVGNREEK